MERESQASVAMRHMALIAEMSRGFALSDDIDRTLAVGLARIVAEMDAVAGSLFVVDEAGGDLVCRVASGPIEMVGRRVPAGQGIVGRCVAEVAAQMVLDVSLDPDFLAAVDADTGFKTKSLLCAPLAVRDECLGAIELVNKRAGAGLFDAEDMATLQVLAAAAALALANAQLSRRLTEQGALKARPAAPAIRDGEGPPWHIVHLRVPARPDGLKPVRGAVTRAVRATVPGCDEVWLQDFVLAIDEACQNIVRHAYGGREGEEFNIDLYHDDQSLEVRLTDFAPAVDPSVIRPRDLDDLRPGGLGTHFINEVMDLVAYETPPHGKGNLLRMVKRFKSGAHWGDEGR